MPKQCHRNLDDHCCHLHGVRCPHLLENVEEGFRWTCGLRKELGSWEAVHQDPRYIQDVQPFWNEWGDHMGQYQCGTYTCQNCIDG